MKYVIAVGDGMADEIRSDLGGKSPLEYAKTPNLDAIAAEGMCGMVNLIPEGFPPGSDIGNMSIMGYAPEKYHTGRAPIEAASIGLALASDEVAFRCNLVTIEAGIMVDYSAGHIDDVDAAVIIDELAQKLNNDRYRFHFGTQYRHILIVRDVDLAKNYTPPHDISGQAIQSHYPDDPIVVEIMEKSAEILSTLEVNARRITVGKLPVTSIWLWGQGTVPSYPSLTERYGITGAVVSAVDLVKGLGCLAGMEVMRVEGATGYLGTNYKGKIMACRDALRRHDFVYLHVEAPDETSHEGDLNKKIQAIEEYDEQIVGQVRAMREEFPDLRIMVLPDHPTYVRTKTHADGPVPFALSGKGISQKDTAQYSERAGEQSGIQVETGVQLFDMFIRRDL